MFEVLFRTNEVSQSTTLAIALSVAASIFLSFLLVITYRLTTPTVVERKEFLQGLALISIVAAMIMQAIGDSVAQGLGILGALSIIRFRTSLQSPRNMAFMFASLGAGIACGVFGFTIAFFGTVAFCLVAGLLAFRRGPSGHALVGDLRVAVPPDSRAGGEVERLLGAACERFALAEYRFTDKKDPEAEPPAPVPPGHAPPTPPPRIHVKELTYELKLRRDADAHDLLVRVEALPDVVDTRLRFQRGVETL